MTTFLIIAGVILYLFGIAFYIDAVTTDIDHGEATRKDARISLIWPILLVLGITKTIIWLLNDVIQFFLLIFGYKYNKTGLYTYIDKTFG